VASQALVDTVTAAIMVEGEGTMRVAAILGDIMVVIAGVMEGAEEAEEAEETEVEVVVEIEVMKIREL